MEMEKLPPVDHNPLNEGNVIKSLSLGLLHLFIFQKVVFLDLSQNIGPADQRSTALHYFI